MQRAIIFLWLILAAFSANAQELRLSKTISGEFDFMTTDHIGRLYLVKGDELFLYSADGELMYRYSDLSRGAITGLDTRNPMKLLLFYPDYGQIAFLDNTLSRTHENVDLNRLELQLAKLACMSFDNGFWVYDPVSFRLVRFDQALNITNDVSNINQLVGADMDPNQMVEVESWLYLNDPDHGIFVFDSFGTYSKLIAIPGADRIQVREHGVFLQIGNHLIKHDPFSFEQLEIALPEAEFRSLSVEKDRLYLLQSDGVKMYSMVE